MGIKLHNISIEGVAPASLSKKKSELHGLIIDHKPITKDEGYKFHGLTIERMTTPNVVVRTFDGAGNVLSGVSVTLSGASIGVSNDLGYVYHKDTNEDTDIPMVATKSPYTSQTVKVSTTDKTTLFQSFYLPVIASTAVVDKAIFRISAQKIVKRSTDEGVRSFIVVLRSNLVTAANFSTSNVTEQQLYDHFIALTSGSPVSDKVILIPRAGKYKYVRRYEQSGTKKYQAVLRSSLATSGNFNSSSHTAQEIFDFMVEYLTGTNP